DRKRAVRVLHFDLAAHPGKRDWAVQSVQRKRTGTRSLYDQVGGPISIVGAAHGELTAFERSLDVQQMPLRRCLLVIDCDFAIQNGEVLPVGSIDVNSTILGCPNVHRGRTLRQRESIFRTRNLAIFRAHMDLIARSYPLVAINVDIQSMMTRVRMTAESPKCERRKRNQSSCSEHQTYLLSLRIDFGAQSGLAELFWNYSVYLVS